MKILENLIVVLLSYIILLLVTKLAFYMIGISLTMTQVLGFRFLMHIVGVIFKNAGGVCND